MVVTKEEYQEWLQHPVTQKLHSVLKQERLGMMEELVLNKEDEEQLRGRIKAVEGFLSSEYEDLYEPKRD